MNWRLYNQLQPGTVILVSLGRGGGLKNWRKE